MPTKYEILLILISFTGCRTSDVGYLGSMYNAKYSTKTIIKLETIVDENQSCVYFENSKAIITLSTKCFLDYAKEKLENDSLCNQKKNDLRSVLKQLNNNSLFYIEEKMSPELYKRLKYPKPKKYKEDFIEPYGYEVVTDTTNKMKAQNLKHWMISEMCIKGKCLVFDKSTKLNVDAIYYIVTDFKDGHGGESLNFIDKRIFYNVDVYSDIIFPDFDCMSETEINEFLKRE